MRYDILPSHWAHLKQARWQAITNGESDASVYRLSSADEIQYLKVTRLESLMPVREEYKRLQWLQGKIAVPMIRDYAETATHQFLLMSHCAGLHPLHDDLSWDAETRIKVLADIAKRFHAIDAQQIPYKVSFDDQIARARKNIDAGVIHQKRWMRTHPNKTYEEGFTDLVSLKPLQEDYVVTHGDFYPVNMCVDVSTQALTGVIDVGRCALADRYTDLALIVNAIGWHLDTDAITQFFSYYGIAPDAQKIRFYQLLDLFRAYTST